MHLWQWRGNQNIQMLFPLPLISINSQPSISLLAAWSTNAHCLLLPTNWQDSHATKSNKMATNIKRKRIYFLDMFSCDRIHGLSENHFCWLNFSAARIVYCNLFRYTIRIQSQERMIIFSELPTKCRYQISMA
jgi:hypothetical protein